MKKHTTHNHFVKEALLNLQLFVSYLLHFRKQDDFISRQNINSIL